MSAKSNGGSLSDKWISGMLFLLRMYIPLMAFSIANAKALGLKQIRVTLKNILFLFASLWLFNEFAYEISLFVRNHFFDLALIPVPAEKQYAAESILGLVLVSFYFLGFHVTMTNSMILLNKGNIDERTGPVSALLPGWQDAGDRR
jgi:hypothetical protein